MKKKYKSIILQFFLLLLIVKLSDEVLLSFFYILLHEISHIILANIYGCKFDNIKINISGTTADISDIDDLDYKKKLKIYLIGPAINFSIAIIIYILSYKYSSLFLKDNMIINLSLGFFNLLPAYPLDGSRICEILLARKYLYRKSKKIIIIVSFIMSVILFLLGVIIIVFLHKLNVSFFLAAALIMYTTFLEKERTMYIIMGDIYKKLTRLKKYGYIENKTISVYYKKGLVSVLTLVDKNKFNTFYVLNDDMEIIKIINEDELIEALKEYGNITLEEYLKNGQ